MPTLPFRRYQWVDKPDISKKHRLYSYAHSPSSGYKVLMAPTGALARSLLRNNAPLEY